MAIQRDDLTNQLDRIALALYTGNGSGPDTIRMATKLMLQASARLRAYEELGLTTNANLKDLDIRVSELERWRDTQESYEREQNE